MSNELKISKGRLALYGVGLVLVTAFLTAAFMAVPEEEGQSNAVGSDIRRAMRRMWRRSKPKYGRGDNEPLMGGEIAMPEKADMESVENTQTN